MPRKWVVASRIVTHLWRIGISVQKTKQVLSKLLLLLLLPFVIMLAMVSDIVGITGSGD
jgi:hypothetical protein